MECPHGLRGTSSSSWNVRSIGPKSECTGLGTGDDLSAVGRTFWKLGTAISKHDTVSRQDNLNAEGRTF